ncbi:MULTISPECIES: hypothetical protein [unclassified Streptomyces]|uniref:hypothetical protein n=1 Tax=unclassified Streptomyces TaxID=2593676 RepID=UPI0022500062|nr:MULTISPECIES: hypothetical protein [unclassified Streptomyces]MCX4882369.1 hypothetical protein [Streptomyces sp. NBC_00847]MCX5422398.1 hypothetical protein [Streptomyces sp. NBC_00078]
MSHPPARTERARPMAAGMALLLAGMLAFALTSDGNAFTHTPWVVGLCLWLLLWAALRSLTRAVAERPADGLDERERDVRNRVGYVGYQFAVASGMAVVLMLVVFQNHERVLDRAPGVLATLMLAAAALPTVILGWSQPDEEFEDGE